MASVEFLPSAPEVTMPLDQDIYWKQWFQNLWKAHRRNLVVAVVQTVAFTPDLESYFYPCDTSGGAFAVTLPPAVNTMGKQIEIYHKTSANALTVVTSGADVISPTTATPIAVGNSVIFISDGISTWYAQIGIGAGITTSPAFKNFLVDGSFEVWDGSRTLTLAAATGYTGATMWSYQSPTNFAQFVISRQASVLPSQYCLRWARTNGQTATNKQSLYYDMESIDSVQFAGQTVVVSFLARKGANYSAASNFLVSSIQTGTGTDQAQRTAAYTGSVITSQNNTLTAAFQLFQQVLAIPAGATQIGLTFDFTPVGTAGAADYYEIDDVQIELGSVATTFERIPWGMQRNRVLRYYWKSFEYDTTPAQFTSATGEDLIQIVGAGVATRAQGITFGIPMRIAGTGTIYNPLAANAQVRNFTRANDCTASAITCTQWKAQFVFTTSAGSALGDLNLFHYTVDARI